MSLEGVSKPMGSRSTRGWWAVYTKHQHEKVVAEILAMKGCKVYVPLYECSRQWKDRKVSRLVPLFPGYLFVGEQPEHRLSVLETPGVHMIVLRGNGFAVIPSEEIDCIRRATETPSAVLPHDYLNVGDRVRVLRGPLAGVTGILVRHKNEYRLILSVETLAKSVAVEVSASDVAAAGTEGHLDAYTRPLAMPFRDEPDCARRGAFV